MGDNIGMAINQGEKSRGSIGEQTINLKKQKFSGLGTKYIVAKTKNKLFMFRNYENDLEMLSCINKRN